MTRLLPRSDPRIRRAIAVAALVLILAGVAWQAFAQDVAPAQQIANWNQSLEKTDLALDNTATSDATLTQLRDQTSRIATDANALAQTLAPRVAAAQTQVDQLAPAKDAPAPESPDAKKTREDAQAGLANLDGTQKQALAVATHATYTLSQINDRRRARFTATLLGRNSSLINPQLWADAIAEVPVQASRTASIFSEWAATLESRNDRSIVAAVLIGLFLLIAAILLPGRRYLLSKFRRDPADGAAGTEPSQRVKLGSATIVVGLNALLPLGVLSAARAVLESLDLMPLRVDLAWSGLIVAATFFGLGFGLIRAFLAPTRPRWRLIKIDDWMAGKLFATATAACLLQAIFLFSATFAKINYASLPFVIAIQGTLSIAIAILLILGVRTANRRSGTPESEDADADDSGSSNSLWNGVLALAGIAAALAIAANLFGYVALGRFITTQLVWLAMVVALLRLLMRLTDELTTRSFSRDGFIGRRMVSTMGVAPRAANQFGVLLNGAVQLVLITLAVLSVTAPWGVDSVSVFDSLRMAFFGFRIGSLSISISTIIAGVAVFAVGVVITRAVQKWLDTRLLPTTRLDSGLRNSIQTGAGYLGMIIAATVAFGYAGLDLSNIAIVAGALSVGIGLGLQAIVNNFVSGLILLAERPIRAGDWVAVAGEEGTVKRINVRATEIETFDRSTLIVPNSTLITGTVKNMVLRDRSGRVLVPISVSKKADADEIRTILLDAAKQHSLVLRYPEPAVFFLNFGVNSLDFELRCYLSDISNGFAVRSDIRFEVLRQLRQREIELPA